VTLEIANSIRFRNYKIGQRFVFKSPGDVDYCAWYYCIVEHEIVDGEVEYSYYVINGNAYLHLLVDHDSPTNEYFVFLGAEKFMDGEDIQVPCEWAIIIPDEIVVMNYNDAIVYAREEYSKTY
jgi:hypothetical protein